MTVATGTHNSANAAGTFLGNGSSSGTLDAALIAAGWTFIEELTAIQAGTTGPVQVYEMATAPKSYIFIEYDNTNARLRFFAAESYDATANQAQYPTGSGAGGAAATPSVTGHSTDSAGTIAATCQYVNVAFENSTAITYVLYTTGTVLGLSCYTAAGATRGVIVGHYTPFDISASNGWKATKPLFITRLHATTGTQWTDTSGYGGTRISQLPRGSTSWEGGFGAIWDFCLPTRIQATTGPVDTMWAGRVNGGTALKGFTNPICTDAVLWHSFTVTNDGGVAGHGPLGYLPDFVVVYVQNLIVGGNQDTLNVDGVTYYVMGHVKPGAGTGMAIAVHS